MRTIHLADLGQPGVFIPVGPPPIAMSMVGVNVYSGGYEGQHGIWMGAQPVADADIVITVQPAPAATSKVPAESQLVGDEGPIVVRAKTPKSGYAEVPIPVPPGTDVDVAVTYAGETQHQTVKTATSSGDAMAEFHFNAGGIPVLAFSIPVAIVVLLVGYWLWHGR